VTTICKLSGLGAPRVQRTNAAALAIKRALDKGLLTPIDDLFLAQDLQNLICMKTSDDFVIPDRYEKVRDFKTDFCISSIRFGLRQSDLLFPRNSWPWMMLRDTLLNCVTDDKYFQLDLEQLWHSNRLGPLVDIALILPTTFSRHIDRGEYIAALANDALTKLSVDDIATDLRPLINRENLVGKSIYHIAEVLREMDEADITAIGSVFLGERGDLLGSAARRLRQNRDRPIEIVLPLVLNQMWDDGLKTVVENQLQALAKDGGKGGEQSESETVHAEKSDQIR
jgi:hypothetical protein